MNTDLGSTLIGALIIVICTIPFIIMGKSRNKKAKQLLNSLHNNASQHNCQITQHEVFGDFAIGMDKEHNALFFARRLKDSEEKQFVDLSKIKNCEIINSGRTIRTKNGNKNGTHTIIDRLELGFTPIVKNEPEIKWEFFNADINYQPNGELIAMRQWSKNINEQLMHS